MNYFIVRDSQQYGPYTLADLQRYVASGEISLDDLASSEGMVAPVPVNQIIGNIAAPLPYQQAAPVAPSAYYADPPNLHWGLVLLFVVLSCGLFGVIWEVVQASWVRKVDPLAKAFNIYMGALALLAGIFFVSFFGSMTHSNMASFTGILQIAYFVVVIVGRFSLKASLEKHFNATEPMGLMLSGVMTFFFGGIYFQYHFNDINKRKMMDRMYAANR